MTERHGLSVKLARDPARGKREPVGRRGCPVRRFVVLVRIQTDSGKGGLGNFLVVCYIQRLAGRIVKECSQLVFPKISWGCGMRRGRGIHG